MRRILFIEDDDIFRERMSNILIENQYQVDDVASPIKALELLSLNDYALIITDLQLPILSGLQFSESAKVMKPHIPIIILTGENDAESEIQAIHNNVDLYLSKDKSIQIILNYIEHYVSDFKLQMPFAAVLTSYNSGISLNTNSRTVYQNEERIELTPIEYEIIKMFLENKNVVLSREQIIEYAWKEYPGKIDERVVDTHIKRIREKLKTFAITTIRGFGYRWNEVGE